MAISITPTDPRYALLKQSRNARFPATASEAVGAIELCDSQETAAAALQRIVDAGKRPTIRSGGHCYEDFVVNNPSGAILDLSLLTESHLPGDANRYRISAGKSLGDTYLDLYKRYNTTIPAGTCYTVGAGGHISGGGYGLLSRLHGLTVDWVSAVDILTVDAKGKVVQRRVDKNHDPDLFRACRGAGGGSFGVITGFLFDKLPPAPREVISTGLTFDWAGMTESRFVDILTTFGNYWETRGKDPATWGLFSIIGLSHASSGHFGMSIQFCNADGTCNDLTVLNEFLDLFDACKPSPSAPVITSDRTIPRRDPSQSCEGGRSLRKLAWLDATIGGGGGSGRRSRAKYKSAYMKRNFSAGNAKCLYKHMKRTVAGADLRGSVIGIDSYGGATNRPAMLSETSASQRSSIMKLQYQSYWQKPEDDAAHLQWMRDMFNEVYSGDKVDKAHQSTPYPGDNYEGCYINYPDCDMLDHPFWPQLYYGEGDLYPFLQKVKRQYDPNNVFHHAMSVRA